MKLCGLLMSCLVSLVLAEDNDSDRCDICKEGIVLLQATGNDTDVKSSISGFRCLIHNETLLRCSWFTGSLPEYAQYSASYIHCSNNQDHPLHCVINSSKKLVECSAEIKWLEVVEEKKEICLEELFVLVNITINDHWYTICRGYEAGDIESLNPPHNIRASKKSKNLEIQWSRTKSFCSDLDKCFIYEVKTNNETIQLEKVLEYNQTNIVPTRSYTIQIRNKLDSTCVSNSQWSDWSDPVVQEGITNVPDVNPVVIASIVFVLPMILLAFLLVCKFQRLFEKLFPSIPNPSKNVQMILENNYFNQDMPTKQCEEGAEILEVTYSEEKCNDIFINGS
ncbi:interleukin-13 receptor subunit alpha-1-like isoform X2 [Tachysurus fulvidraco]|nr:interleukin-13 receptor subunit alpha-1-like isoform X2 [Tachysurus fulvidraco]XP_047658940.1 interleukin-13 receptor subunit alpha-1-like isoform X2 [Tachysurus fulvidraco]